MNELLRLLAQNALLLAGGTTLLLAAGCGAAAFCKSPVHRQRISELAIAGVLAWLVLALFPLPRLLPEFVASEPEGAATEAFQQTSDFPVLQRRSRAPSYDVDPIWQIEAAPEPAFLPDSFDVPRDPLIPITASPSEEVAATPEPSIPLPAIQEISATENWHIDWQQLAGLFTGAYLAGAAICVLWIAAGHLLLLRIRQTADDPPAWLLKQYHALASEAGIHPPQLIVSRLCSRPLTWGVLWPVVVLPEALCRTENKSQLRMVMLHELGHIVQQDAQGNLLLWAALPLLFAHPLYWWLRRESQLSAELVADDWAAGQTGKETYVEELVALAKCTGRGAIPLVGVTGLFSSPSLFYRRMHMLLAREKPLSTRTSLSWRLTSLSVLVASVAVAASLAGVRPAVGQAPPGTTPAIEPAAAPPTPPLAANPPLPPATTPAAPTTPAPAIEPSPVAPPATRLPDPNNIPMTPPALPGATPPVLAPPTVPSLPAVPAPPGELPGVQFAPERGNKIAAMAVPLDPEEAALLAEIKSLQDKLQALEKKRRPDAPGKKSPGIKAVNLQPGTKTIVLTRVDESGRIWSEQWTTDEKGQPSKIMTKTELPNAGQPAGLAFSSDGKTIRHEVVEKDGRRLTYVLDAATGKMMAKSETGGRFTQLKDTTDVVPPEPKGNRTVERRYPVIGTFPAPSPHEKGPQPSTVKVPSGYPVYGTGVVDAQPAGVPQYGKGNQQLDLISLATSYADAASALEAADAKMADIAKMSSSPGTISQHEILAAKLGLSAAQRKERLLRSIAEVATESAAQDLDRLSKAGAGADNSAAAADAKTRLTILKAILGTKSGETPVKP